MEVIENAARLKARLLEQQPDASRPGWFRVRLQIDEVAAVANLPNLFSIPADQPIEVLVGPEDGATLESLKAGEQLCLQVRLRAPGVYTVIPGSLRCVN